jgi:hypothetical protein
MTDEFAKTPPPPPNFGVQMLRDQLIIAVPHHHKSGVETKFGLRDVLDVSVVVLSGPFEGQEYVGEQFMSGKLVAQLKGLIGQVALGRITLEPGARPGAMGPLILADPTGADQETAQRWMAAHPGRLGQLKTDGARVAAARMADREQSQGQAAGYGYPPGYGQQSQGSPQFSQPGGQQQQQFPQPPAPLSQPPF